MPFAEIDGVNLYYELKGETGEPPVFVHDGSWDHHSRDAASDLLSKDFRVLSYVTFSAYAGARHGPHSSHPAEYVSRVRKFISENS